MINSVYPICGVSGCWVSNLLLGNLRCMCSTAAARRAGCLHLHVTLDYVDYKLGLFRAAKAAHVAHSGRLMLLISVPVFLHNPVLVAENKLAGCVRYHPPLDHIVLETHTQTPYICL